MIAAENAASGPLSDAEARRIFRAWIRREGAAYAIYRAEPCDATRQSWLTVLAERPPLYGPHMGMIPKQKRFKMYSCHRPTAAGTR